MSSLLSANPPNIRFLVFPLLLPKSPRWLASKARGLAALAAITTAAKANNLPASKDISCIYAGFTPVTHILKRLVQVPALPLYLSGRARYFTRPSETQQWESAQVWTVRELHLPRPFAADDEMSKLGLLPSQSTVLYEDLLRALHVPPVL